MKKRNNFVSRELFGERKCSILKFPKFRNPKIRLGCTWCDRTDYDMITDVELENAIQDGWSDVVRIQFFQEACKTYQVPEQEPVDFCVLDWETHLGTCPDCIGD